MNTLTLRIEGMHCEGCANRVRTVLDTPPGVREIEVSLDSGEARVRHNPHHVQAQGLLDLIEGAGFRASIIGQS